MKFRIGDLNKGLLWSRVTLEILHVLQLFKRLSGKAVHHSFSCVRDRYRLAATTDAVRLRRIEPDLRSRARPVSHEPDLQEKACYGKK